MVAYSAYESKNTALVRKALQGALFLGSMSAAIPTRTSLVGAGGALSAVPTGYTDIGLVEASGYVFGRNINTNDVTSMGNQQATRSDNTEDQTTITFVAQETKLLTLGLFTGVDTSTLTVDTNGSLSIQKPLVPPAKYWRAFIIGRDTTQAGNDIYIFRVFPKVKVTAYSDQTFTDQGAITYGCTLSEFLDSGAGYVDDFIVAGPGVQAGDLKTAMGLV